MNNVLTHPEASHDDQIVYCFRFNIHERKIGEGTDGKAENEDWNYCPYCGVKIKTG